MPDKIFEDHRLVEIYDAFDGPRNDLDHYLALVKEFKAKSILDVGCGTGSFACLLSLHGFNVIALDPAEASVQAAQRKMNADRVRWIVGDTRCLPTLSVDMAVMTGNVAQVFLTDDEWEKNLAYVRQSLRPNGLFVFEVRNPANKAWLDWTPAKTRQRIDVAGVGPVEGWCEVTNVSEEFVSFRWTYAFESDGKTISSDSTLRFRDINAIEASLKKLGFVVREIREAPDRPGKEFVFIASRVAF